MTERVTGTHLLVDLYGAQHLADAERIERAMRTCAAAIGATVLEVTLHRFGGEGGVTGVMLLAESHLSIHTWPESGFAAIDVFVCGALDPAAAVPVIKAQFAPERVRVRSVARGEGDTATTEIG